MIREPLVDSFGRQMRDLRLSITDRCDLRCLYCMPEEGLDWLGRDELLTVDELVRLVTILAGLGVNQVRVTGGEPTVHPQLLAIISGLRQVPGIESLSLTTNGVRLEKLASGLAAAGLTRINVSLDSLDHARYHRATRRPFLDRVLAGLAELERHPSISPIKVNVVAMRDFTEPDISAFALLARTRPYVVRFIEFMPLDAGGDWRRELVLTGREIREVIEREVLALSPIEADTGSTSRRYRFVDGVGEIGFVNPVSEPFCADCNRVRITADGQFRTCLFSLSETDLRTPLRSGASDGELELLLRAAVAQKELKHHINDGAFIRPSRSMSQIGG
ncbi:MAG: GTP 3',8-cyclase MoaA [Candidatus Dormibacteria bacterium]